MKKKPIFLPYDKSRYVRTRNSLNVQYKTFSKNDVKSDVKRVVAFQHQDPLHHPSLFATCSQEVSIHIAVEKTFTHTCMVHDIGELQFVMDQWNKIFHFIIRNFYYCSSLLSRPGCLHILHISI